MDNSSDEDIEYLETTKSSKNANKDQEAIESDEDETPNGAECLSRCKQFAEITGTDKALAMFFLQDTNWNLEKSLNAFFAQTKPNNSKIVTCIDVGKCNQDEERASKRSSEASEQDSSLSSSKRSKNSLYDIDTSSPELAEAALSPTPPRRRVITPPKFNSRSTSTKSALASNSSSLSFARSPSLTCSPQGEENEKYFKIMSWNIDGLDNEPQNLMNRTIGVVTKILNESPDVVFLQEVVETSEQILRERLSKHYAFTVGFNGCNYYTTVLTKLSTCELEPPTSLIKFSNTVMGRNLLQVKLVYKKQVAICAMTSHLESGKEFGKQRTAQLQQCFRAMTQLEPEYVVFFGGDLNMRDAEVTAVGGLPSKVCDVWEATGARKECLYTWDTSRNTNLSINAKWKPRCRFDRLYYRGAFKRQRNSEILVANESLTLMPVYFELEGLEKLKSCNRFCSDHWAIQAYCQLERLRHEA